MSLRLSARSLPKFQDRLLDWFASHRRQLPWRTSCDPYRVWVAEVMLQQTRIAAAEPYYQRFLAHFPDMDSLSRARLNEVLKLWSGLGYYSRARNLHAAAKAIMTHHRGRFPREPDAALALPGVGRYTAAAVLSIAYDVPLAVLDGNVARVLARLGAVRGDLRALTQWEDLSVTADQLLPRRAPGEWNQALMELGETVCTPKSPHCQSCPVSRWCGARALGLTAEIPVPRKKRAAVRMTIAAAILRDPGGRTLLVRDPGAHDGALFSRMWQFPAVEVMKRARGELAEHLRTALGVNVSALMALRKAHHGVTFRNITLLPFLAEVPHLPKRPRTRILPLDDVKRVPVSSATHKIAAAAAAIRPAPLG